jgi:GNAT superfamily N-acetyltransferase
MNFQKIYENSNFDIQNIRFSILDTDNMRMVHEYHRLAYETMHLFNLKQMDSFQDWFISTEGILCRKNTNEDALYNVQFLALYKNRIVGLLEIEDQHWIQTFCVNSKYHNKGIGRNLLKYSLFFFKKNGIHIPYYEVYSSEYAHNIYKSLGFLETSKDSDILVWYP